MIEPGIGEIGWICSAGKYFRSIEVEKNQVLTRTRAQNVAIIGT
ncbi:hypothetical protein [Pelosinus propionicus]|nr:hypothetical protein [Pelosinus propionicus]